MVKEETLQRSETEIALEIQTLLVNKCFSKKRLSRHKTEIAAVQSQQAAALTRRTDNGMPARSGRRKRRLRRINK